jgi:hypothetical protein
MDSVVLKKPGIMPVSQSWGFGDIAYEIKRIPAICEYGDVVREKHETL